MPWAITLGNPNALAPTPETWMGLRSPDTAAYSAIWPSDTDLTTVGLPSSPAVGGSGFGGRGASLAGDRDVRRFESMLERWSQAGSSSSFSSPVLISVTTSTNSPDGCSRRFSACARIDSSSPTRSARREVISLNRCTDPIAGNGKPGSNISCMVSGNVSVNGYVSGSASLSRRSHTLAYAARLATSTFTPETSTPFAGTDVASRLPPTSGTDPSAALPYCASRLGMAGSFVYSISDHAPSSDWPHTRITLSVTAEDAGLAK